MNNSKNRSRLGQSVKYAVVLLAGLALFGLSGCHKAQEYIVAVEDSGKESALPDAESAAAKDTEGMMAQDAAETDSCKDTGISVYVDICGAVKYPGVYELPGDARVFEAVESAGGLLEEACAKAVNQAEKLQDGQKIYIPTIEEWEEAGMQPGVEEEAPASDGLVNINTADMSELCSLPGVGESRAKAIMQYREEQGAFGSIEEIQNVPGIKNGLFLKMKDFIKVR